MNRRSTKPAWIMFLLLVLAGAIPVFGQVRGYELYKKLTAERRNLISFEGVRDVRWTPDGGSYIVSKDKTFLKVDPATGEESPLFDDQKLIAAYKALTGETADRASLQRVRFRRGRGQDPVL